jgi:two-component system, OmpR family, phosphate regulon sensor histidine kinase PhoR
MKVSIRWKVMATYLLLALPVTLLLYAYLSHLLRDHLHASAQAGLRREAHLARLMTERELAALRRDAPAAAAAVGREISVRVTMVAADGTVVGDSEIPPEQLSAVENHLDRPEIRDALAGGSGSASRYSSTLRTTMLYVALPMQTRGGERGVIRLALPFSELDTATARMRSALAGTLAVAVLLSVVLSYLFAGGITGYLRRIAGTAARLGRGDLGHRIPVRTRDELGDLAAAVNEMADRMQEQLGLLAAEKNRLDAILRGMGEGVMVADAAATVTLVNPAFAAFFGAGDAEGKKLFDISRHPVLHETFRHVVETGTGSTTELELVQPERTLLTNWVPLRERDLLTGVVAVFHDITELKRLEDVRRDFVANVSHELRTPVAAIKGYAETLLIHRDTGTADKFLQVIHDQAERLGNLVRDLLTLSRLDAARDAGEVAPVNVAAVAAGVLSLLGTKAAEKGVSLTGEGIDCRSVTGDRYRIEQVLINLVENAIKFTPAGRSVTLTAGDADDFVRVSVADTGIGIPPKDLPRIFERFYRVDPGRSREEGGTGLGLAIVKHIVQLHGGTVSVASTPGKGSVFSFTLKKA